MLVCPSCKHNFAHSNVGAATIRDALRDPYRVMTKPAFAVGEIRSCPFCKVKTAFRALDLKYSAADV
jgi:hypothetical protein